MSSENRREFLKLAGGVVGVGSALSASGCLAAGGARAPMAATTLSNHDELPPLRGSYAEEDWTGLRGGPGNTATADQGPTVGDSPECRPIYEPEDQFNWEAAIVGDTMYVTSNGGFRALDTTDGSIRWTSDDVGVLGTPSAAYDRLFGTGRGSVTALDVDDQSVAWEVPYEDRATTPAVGYEMVFSVLDGAIRAMDVEDGATVWEVASDENGEDFQLDTLALGAGQVYALDGSDNVVAYDAANGEHQWTDNTQLTYSWGLAATDQYVTASSGRASEEYRVLDVGTGEWIASGQAWQPPALDDELVVNVTHSDVRVDFFDDRDGWRSENFSTMALGPPAMDEDTVYVYLGDGGSKDNYSLLAYDKYSGERKWTCEVDDSVGTGGSVAVTNDQVFAFGSREFHVVDGESQGDDSGGEETPTESDGSDADDGTTEDGSTDDGTSDGDGGSSDDGGSTSGSDSSTNGDEATTGSETATPGDETGGAETERSTATSTDADDEFGSEGGDATPTGDSSTGTAGDEGSSVERVAVEEATETGGDGPGFGVASAVSGLGGLAYLFRRRLGDDATDADGVDDVEA